MPEPLITMPLGVRKFAISVAAALLPLSFACAEGRLTFHADFEQARWVGDYSVFGCRLSQTIPRFGEASFYHQAGENLLFQISAPENVMNSGQAALVSRAPIWKQGSQERQGLDIGAVELERSGPIMVGETEAERMMAELDRGMMPTLIHSAWFDESEQIHVAVSPVKFQLPYEEYRRCLADLLPVNFSQIERSTIFWQMNQTELSPEATELLDNIIAYTEADPSVSGFEVNGFTDSAGNERDNLRISEQRAVAVHDYLARHGIPQEMISTRYFGETEAYRIIRNEKAPEDFDRNRRVTILIRRD